MKKILLATTALALSAGVAQAQGVTIGGEGRMGIQYNNGGFPGGSNYQIENRLQLNFSVAVEGDHGLSFGAFTRARMQMGGVVTGASVGTGGFNTNGATVFSGSRVWVEANGFRLTFGNTDGAFRGAGASHGYLGGCAIGYEGGQQCGDSAGLLGVTQGFVSTLPSTILPLGTPAQRVRADYTMGDTRVAVSHDRGGATEVGVRSGFDAFTVAAGFTNGGAGTASSYALSGHYDAGSWGAGLIVARRATGATGQATTFSLSANAQLGGGTLAGYVGRVNTPGAPANSTATSNAYGLNYAYGLGGGANLVVGAERVATTTTASVGVVFGF